MQHLYNLLHLKEGLEDQQEVILKFHFDFQHPFAFCSVTRQQHYKQTVSNSGIKRCVLLSHVAFALLH